MTTISVTPGDNPQGAANMLQPGDTLLFKTGIHYGKISIPVDGVVIAGEVGTALEGTEAVTGTWTLATDSDGYTSLAGTGTWRAPLAQQPWVVMDTPSSMIFRIDSDYVGVIETLGYYYMTAYGALAVPNNARPGPDSNADWWNGIEAMWVYNLGNQHLYVRYRDGKKPVNLRWSGGHYDHRDNPTQAGSVIWLAARRDITITGLEVRGCVSGISVVEGSSNITIERCSFKGFDFAVDVIDACNGVRVLDSAFDSCLHGTTRFPPVSKISTENPSPEIRYIAYHQYAMNKFWHDESDSTHIAGLKIRNGWIESTQTVLVPKNIEFTRNHARHMAFAVDMFGGDGIDLGYNTVENCWDMSFQRSPGGGRNIKIHDNVVREAGYCLMRWHGSDWEAGDNYVYNNRVSDVASVSNFMYHGISMAGRGKKNWFLKFLIWLWKLLRSLFKKPKGITSYLRIWYYNNTFSGGLAVWFMDGSMSSWPGFCAVNNLLSHIGTTSNAEGWPAEIGLFDYNTMSGSLGAWGSNWYGSHNVTNMPAIWPCDQVEKEFIVPDGHSSKGTGVDVSRTFTINGRNYGPLPGFEPGYFEGAAPDRGWIDRGENGGGGDIVAATFTVMPDAVAPGADVEVSWTGGASAKDWYKLCKIGENHADDKYGWAYTSSCSQAAGTIIKASGTCLFTMPIEPGNYEFQFLADNGYTVIATSNQVTIAEPVPPEPEPEVIMAFVPVWIEKPESVTPIEPSEFQALLKRKKPKS